LVDPVTRGDPESPLRWTSKSTRKLAAELGEQGFQLSPQKVSQLLRASGYSLQSTNKTLEGTSHPDRNEQFEFISERVDEFQARGAPVISVDTKKKSWSVISRMPGASGSRKVSRCQCAFTTSSTAISAR
jgi:hypothetical protein